MHVKLNRDSVENTEISENELKANRKALGLHVVHFAYLADGYGNVNDSYCQEGTMLTLWASVKSIPVQQGCATQERVQCWQPSNSLVKQRHL